MLKKHGLTQAEVAKALDRAEATISRKVCGRAPWLLSEALAVKALIERRSGQKFDIEDLLAKGKR